MTLLQSLERYKDFGFSCPDHPAYLEAEETKRWRPNDPKINKLYLQAVSACIEQAQAASSPEMAALFYARACWILKPPLSIDAKLYQTVRKSEADACRKAADEASSPSDKALWHYFTASHLVPEPIYIHSLRALETVEAISLAASSWEALGDLCREYKKEIKISFLSITPSTNETWYGIPHSPEYHAALSYINAAYALYHARMQLGHKECLPELMQVVDKAIATLESIDITADNFQNNAHHFDLLALVYQSKLHNLRLQHNDQKFKDPLLEAKIIELRLESADRFEKTIAQDPEKEGGLHYHRAFNLQQAASFAESKEEKTKLMLLAAESAKEYRLYKGLSNEKWSQRESQSEQYACNIIAEALHLKRKNDATKTAQHS